MTEDIIKKYETAKYLKELAETLRDTDYTDHVYLKRAARTIEAMIPNSEFLELEEKK